jgi:hypothetical protein
MNATVSRIKAWWENTRDKSDPKTCPSIQAFRDITYMGRSAKVNIFGVAQMLTANTTGGPESRENFGIRALARYTANNWKMLVPECPMPRSVRVRGRWQIVSAGEATAVQVAFLTTAEARVLARPVGDIQPTRPGWPGPVSQTSQTSPEPAMGGSDRPSPTLDVPDIDLTAPADVPQPADPLNELVTLREAVEMGLVDGLEDAVRKRLQRAIANGENAPTVRGKKGNANQYRRGDLIEWGMGVKH